MLHLSMWITKGAVLSDTSFSDSFFFFHFVCYHTGRIKLNCKTLFIYTYISYCAALKKDKTVIEGFIECELIDLNYTLVAVVVESCNNRYHSDHLSMCK